MHLRHCHHTLGFYCLKFLPGFLKVQYDRMPVNHFFSVMDANSERKGTPLPFVKMSTTRWLVRGNVLNNLLLNWEELKAYFASAEQIGGADARYKARMIRSMPFDNVNYLYMTFLAPIVSEFDRVNSTFQAPKADPQYLINELTLHYRSLYNREYDSDRNCLPLESVDFGCKFLADAAHFSTASDNPQFTDAVGDMKVRCSNFLVALVTEVEKGCLMKTLSELTAFHPDVVLSQTARLPFSSLPFKHLITESEVNKLEQQYRNIVLIPWAEENVFVAETGQQILTRRHSGPVYRLIRMLPMNAHFMS